MRRSGYAAAIALLLGYAAIGWAFPWTKDMVDQPSPKAHRSEPPPSPGSVPAVGTEIVPAPATEADLFAAKEEAAALPNPVPATAESIAAGEALYEVHCAICHGTQGRGDGPVGRVFEPVPADLNDDYVQDQADGQLFFTITRGRIEMPYYRDALSQQERWDVINYIRSAFGGRQ
jgi:mono/diheme cytochrome c family protein